MFNKFMVKLNLDNSINMLSVCGNADKTRSLRADTIITTLFSMFKLRNEKLFV